ncbi:pyridoxamine 5'-phosphate oxidase family protein [Paenibacillus mendelii]|uniref:Pyridoxamine 5'-phosphate oxidase family protein n=1 Tax=Paenibacillus mendelii TaxID=206163 RepID=A0ABV6JAY5_9BACL|nr:pyridoxamine 5'-phosphate oxidase family protein [Paenibacillus mendelii]MCQ6562930.1 pyridoxamine 5'-phosphate oxidase family protein [Paenibacillus mendelii]
MNSNTSIFNNRVESEDELRQLLGYPNPVVAQKTITTIDAHCRSFISLSPMVYLATSDSRGSCDVSPRGDAPGFVYVLDEKHLVIPERPGNRKMDSFLNLLENPHAGLIFIIPGLEETLRMNGRASIITDPDLMEKMSSHGKIPKLGIGIQVEACYFHCGKAFRRSELWKPESWPDLSAMPTVAKMLADHVGVADVTAESVAQGLRESYEKRLY